MNDRTAYLAGQIGLVLILAAAVGAWMIGYGNATGALAAAIVVPVNILLLRLVYAVEQFKE